MREYEQTVGRANTCDVGGGIVFYPLNMKAAIFTKVDVKSTGTVAQDTGVMYSKTQSLKVSSDAATPEVDDETQAVATCGLRGAHIVVVEYKARSATGSAGETNGIEIVTELKNVFTTLGIRWNGTQCTFEYMDTAGVYRECGCGTLKWNDLQWYRISAVLDLKKGEYKEITVNGIHVITGPVLGKNDPVTTSDCGMTVKLISKVTNLLQSVNNFDELLITEAV